MEDLFKQAARERMAEDAPLAVRMRPRTLDEFIGQEQILGPGKPLRRSIEADRLTSAIFYGPPGTGKTTVARIIASMTKARFEQMNAVTSGVADVRRVISEAEERRALYGKKTIVLIDEIHRFNRAQQDALLPAVEDGTITLIGATTENPFFSINSPLLSRSRLFRFVPLSEDEIKTIVELALKDRERGLGNLPIVMAAGAMDYLVRQSNGDARAALNSLELAVRTTAAKKDGSIEITLDVLENCIQVKALRYDRTGDNHYDVVSAFIKSMRGSDPDATLYWLARMLEAGEDPRFIARRIVIHASEDVGNADPMALVVATSAANAIELVGLPEGRLALAQAALYVACAPKSNSVCSGIASALEAVQKLKAGEVPEHLRDASYRGAEKLGHGIDYKYPHDYPGHYVAQEYLPSEIKGRRFYEPSDQGAEERIRRMLASRTDESRKDNR